MVTTAEKDASTITLHGIVWDQADAIARALGEYHSRHTYNGRDLELMRLLHGVSWDDYAAFLQALGDYSLRHTYDGWTLEMMSPRKDHDRVAHLLGRFIEQMTIRLGISIQSVGSMTVSSPLVRQSVQPDQGYYVTHEPQVSGKPAFDPLVDPPPDLIIEVDVTNSSVPRIPAFAALAIPELWHYDGKQLRFYRLNAAKSYDDVPASGEFPWLSPQDVMNFLDRHTTVKENELTVLFADAAKARFDAWNDTRPKGAP